MSQPEHSPADHRHGHDHSHDHGFAPEFLPHWMQHHWTFVQVAAAGLFLALGFLGEKVMGLPPPLVLGFYLLAYVSGGYEIARATPSRPSAN